MFRLLVLLVTLVFVTPALAESAFEASMKRALTEAHCPPYSRREAVRAAVCRSIAMQPVIGPASLGNFEAMMEGNIESASKFDDGRSPQCNMLPRSVPNGRNSRPRITRGPKTRGGSTGKTSATASSKQ